MASASQRLVEALGAVSAHPEGLTVTDLSRKLEISMATGSRLLASLVDAGLVSKVDQQRHVLDLRIWSLGVQAAAPVRRIADIARPMVIDAVRNSDLLIALAVLHGRDAVFLEVSTATRGAVVVAPNAATMPAHACAPGKAILAYSDPAVVDAFLDQPLEQVTDATITSPEALRDELVRTRARGYALNLGEYQPETVAVAVPVFDEKRQPVASVGSSGPATALSEADLQAAAVVLSALSDSISAALGYFPEAHMVG